MEKQKQKLEIHENKEIQTEVDEKEIKKILKEMDRVNQRILAIESTIAKYSSVGLDRETPKKHEHEIKQKFDVRDLTRAMRDVKLKQEQAKAIPADFKEK